MSDEDIGTVLFVGSVIWTVLAVMLGATIGKDIGQHKNRIEAVEAGHARWIVAPNGSTTFEWNPK